jgi:hypothetical protein
MGVAHLDHPMVEAPVSELCEEPHPDRPTVLCDKPKPCFAYHCNSEHHETWGDRPIPGDRLSDPHGLINLVRRIREYTP